MNTFRFTGKSILLISPEPWDHIFVSKHHYAVHLASAGNNVFFLNPPGEKNEVAATDYVNLFQVNYKGFPRGLRFYPRFLQRWFILRVFRRIEDHCKANFHVVWSFDNSVFYDFSALPGMTLKISHIVDSCQNFQTRVAASTADCCICVSEPIRMSLVKYRKDVFKVGHGFHALTAKSTPTQRKYRSKLKAVYAGNLSIPYIDWALFRTVIDAHPDVDFIFVGPCDNALVLKPIVGRNNVFFVGRVSSEELVGYYTLADILLVAYQERHQKDQTSNTHKMMEYLGSGKVVVATRTLEYSDFYPLVVMSETNEDWPVLLTDVIKRITYFNSEELQKRRIAFAMDRTYGKQISRIEQIINEKVAVKGT